MKSKTLNQILEKLITLSCEYEGKINLKEAAGYILIDYVNETTRREREILVNILLSGDPTYERHYKYAD